MLKKLYLYVDHVDVLLRLVRDHPQHRVDITGLKLVMRTQGANNGILFMLRNFPHRCEHVLYRLQYQIIFNLQASNLFKLAKSNWSIFALKLIVLLHGY